MWAGALFNVEYVVYGALIVSFGLSLWQAAAAWLDTTVWKGPLSSATHGADFSIFLGALVGGLTYLGLGRSQV